MIKIEIAQVDWEFASVFRIAYRTRTHAQTVQVSIHDSALVGRGEALGVSYAGESVETLIDQLSAVAPDIRNGVTREELQTLLPAGGARNALDCALWDLEAKRAGKRVWELAGLDAVRPLITTYTLGVASPDAMAEAARAARRFSKLKLKLAGTQDRERVRAVRDARPDAELVVDANQSWPASQIHALIDDMAGMGVTLIEQPLPADDDEALRGLASAIPLCADEACQTMESLGGLAGKYAVLNIKLDKTGGLTEALRLAKAARAQGFGLMIGCMGGSSLSMAPAFVIGQYCDVVDLDGPLLATSDVAHGIRYDGSRMYPPSRALWG